MNDFDKLTMADLCKLALECQDASNLSGVTHTFSKILPRLRALLEVEPGDFTVNNHPVTVMFSNKISSLAGFNVCCDDEGYFAKALSFVQKKSSKDRLSYRMRYILNFVITMQEDPNDEHIRNDSRGAFRELSILSQELPNEEYFPFAANVTAMIALAMKKASNMLVLSDTLAKEEYMKWAKQELSK